MVRCSRPVYGLIFLFRWREDEEKKEEPECPNGVWFANQVGVPRLICRGAHLLMILQTIDNACATIAMLNIVNNIQGVELGENLQAFKDFTKDFTPPLRGDAIANFQFVKEIHNSFARSVLSSTARICAFIMPICIMYQQCLTQARLSNWLFSHLRRQVDILNEDVQMKEKARSKKTGKELEVAEEDDAPCFHFIAFVPVEGKVWKLDGLERQPQNLGKNSLPSIWCQLYSGVTFAGNIETSDWIFHVKPELQDRMARHEDGQTEFSILALVKAPLDGVISQLAQNVKDLGAVREKLNAVRPVWENETGTSGHAHLSGQGVITGQSLAYSLTQGQLDKTEVSPNIQAMVLRDTVAANNSPRAGDIQGPADNKLDNLLTCMQELVNQQVDLRTSISEELEACNQDRERAAKRRQDWTPPIELLVKFLSKKGDFSALLERSKAWSPHAGWMTFRLVS